MRVKKDRFALAEIEQGLCQRNAGKPRSAAVSVDQERAQHEKHRTIVNGGRIYPTLGE
jgi:hypothetical protein